MDFIKKFKGTFIILIIIILMFRFNIVKQTHDIFLDKVNHIIAIIYNDTVLLTFFSFISIILIYGLRYFLHLPDEKYSEEYSFSDVYKDRNANYVSLEAIQKVLEANKSLSSEEIKNLIHDTLEKKRLEQEEYLKREQTEKFSSFSNYFNTIVIYFSEEAQKANASAAMALDNGKKYAMAGISFLVSSIIIWQILYIVFGEKPQFIYGIVSCSLLFIFIECISGWFLKQYKTFVDTATYLMKIKCMFERYMLSYMLLKETNMPPEQYSNLLLSLQDDIKWPETYLLKNADINFAKEAIETMTHMLKNIKDSVQKKEES